MVSCAFMRASQCVRGSTEYGGADAGGRYHGLDVISHVVLGAAHKY